MASTWCKPWDLLWRKSTTAAAHSLSYQEWSWATRCTTSAQCQPVSWPHWTCWSSRIRAPLDLRQRETQTHTGTTVKGRWQWLGQTAAAKHSPLLLYWGPISYHKYVLIISLKIWCACQTHPSHPLHSSILDLLRSIKRDAQQQVPQYPSFLRTIPSDKNQVEAMIQLLIRFNWKWIALLGSDNAYGLKGMQSLSKEAPNHGICIAYQGVIPSFKDDTIQTMRNMVDNILKTKVNTIVVFSSKSKLSGFIPFVIERNVTGKVWIGTEDWSVATLISGIPGINTIGTVIGVSIKYAAISGFEDFERKVFEAAMQQSDTQEVSNGTTSQGKWLPAEHRPEQPRQEEILPGGIRHRLLLQCV